ncbi:RluA family pseudouridine synthase [Acetobacterium paludosum]|uniref:RNA pseudouridylate synthase n=1 Tax=Acetobacterium paludosum TaxID=52693 RepID=A0A923KRB4_9FIRM|nr:RluA family pseudouridine synthase [Acetobacterium paludosum]MBC3887077.1 RluA family pseudouridine synthase [Acetobacterium paludosum]
MKEIIITENENNQRLDRFLKKLMPQASTGFLQKMLRKKRIKLNGQKSEPSTKIITGDVLHIYFSEETISNFRSSRTLNKKISINDTSLDIIYEDSNLLVLNKPSGILTQPDKTDELSLVDYAVDYLIKKGDYNPKVNLTFTPACANRLDKNTTGIILVPKNYKTLQSVNEAIRTDQTRKIYYALILGHPKECGEIIGYLKKDPIKNTVTFSEKPTSATDKKSILNYETIESHGDYSLLKITLQTGRSHQIRVQLSAMGYPILGDPKYGNRHINSRLYEDFGVKNQLLHSAEFTLTTMNKTFEAPFPYIFLKSLKNFGFSESFDAAV